ncbi:hypothetical protein LXL04_031901 [Taraxacum kok-saghyz]
MVISLPVSAFWFYEVVGGSILSIYAFVSSMLTTLDFTICYCFFFLCSIMNIMDASDFWDVIDTKELTKEEIVLVTSYFVATWRKTENNILSDMFVKEAKIVEVKELPYGTDIIYDNVAWKGGADMDPLTFYCHEKLMMVRLKVDPTKPLTADQLKAMYPLPKIDTLFKLSKYMSDYYGRNFVYTLAEMFAKNGENPMLDPKMAKEIIEMAKELEEGGGSEGENESYLVRC